MNQREKTLLRNARKKKKVKNAPWGSTGAKWGQRKGTGVSGENPGSGTSPGRGKARLQKTETKGNKIQKQPIWRKRVKSWGEQETRGSVKKKLAKEIGALSIRLPAL